MLKDNSANNEIEKIKNNFVNFFNLIIYPKVLINRKLRAINNWLLDSNLLYGKEY